MFKTHTTPLQDRLALRPLREIMVEASDPRIPAAKRVASLEHALKARGADPVTRLSGPDADLTEVAKLFIMLDIARSYVGSSN